MSSRDKKNCVEFQVSPAFCPSMIELCVRGVIDVKVGIDYTWKWNIVGDLSNLLDLREVNWIGIIRVLRTFHVPEATFDSNETGTPNPFLSITFTRITWLVDVKMGCDGHMNGLIAFIQDSGDVADIDSSLHYIRIYQLHIHIAQAVIDSYMIHEFEATKALLFCVFFPTVNTRS